MSDGRWNTDREKQKAYSGVVRPDPRAFEKDFYGTGIFFSEKNEAPRNGGDRSHGDAERRSQARRMESGRREKYGEARREAGERRRAVNRRRWLLLAAASVAVLAVLMFLGYKFIFVVRTINVEGEGIYSAETILSASGVGEGVNLYSFRASTVEKNITLKCPYIGSVEVDRQIPNKMTITVTEDKPTYYAVIFGEYKLISEKLRVLGEVETKEDLPEGLIKLKLPAVSYSVSGRVIKFADAKRERSVRDVLKAASESGISEKLTMIDLRDQFNMAMVCDGKQKIMIGNEGDLEYKLKIAEKILEDEIFASDTKYKIDFTVEGKTGAVPDENIEVE
ncbi:MAG: FtsQ-type POTRA domain-containing protein [Clostridia bacterium]|nr:FtsQ-type POTRA domain-containing protein [Clostridia bacterium]